MTAPRLRVELVDRRLLRATAGVEPPAITSRPPTAPTAAYRTGVGRCATTRARRSGRERDDRCRATACRCSRRPRTRSCRSTAAVESDDGAGNVPAVEVAPDGSTRTMPSSWPDTVAAAEHVERTVEAGARPRRAAPWAVHRSPGLPLAVHGRRRGGRRVAARRARRRATVRPPNAAAAGSCSGSGNDANALLRVDRGRPATRRSWSSRACRRRGRGRATGVTSHEGRERPGARRDQERRSSPRSRRRRSSARAPGATTAARSDRRVHVDQPPRGRFSDRRSEVNSLPRRLRAAVADLEQPHIGTDGDDDVDGNQCRPGRPCPTRAAWSRRRTASVPARADRASMTRERDEEQQEDQRANARRDVRVAASAPPSGNAVLAAPGRCRSRVVC